VGLSILFLALISIIGNGPDNSCSCRPAAADDFPHGANEVIQSTARPVKQLRGNVMLQNGQPVSEAVVEVYDYSGRDKKRPYEPESSKKRKAACLTDEKGEFCFTRLPAGNYLLKVGTQASAGINYSFVIVTLSPHLRSSRKLEISLNLGT
jgi:protocatechuate 3,4-dioxygenase beta subunit